MLAIIRRRNIRRDIDENLDGFFGNFRQLPTFRMAGALGGVSGKEDTSLLRAFCVYSHCMVDASSRLSCGRPSAKKSVPCVARQNDRGPGSETGRGA